MGDMETVIFPYGVNFYLMKQIFLHIGLNFYHNRNFYWQGNFSHEGWIFTLRATIFTGVTEVWPCANRAVVPNN